jgi:P-type Cu+ transporter
MVVVANPSTGLRVDSCAHCGAGGAFVQQAGERFCCTGCAQVFSILKDRDLLAFYDFPENDVASLRERPVADFSYCDSDWFRRLFVRSVRAEVFSMRLKLPAIHCAACVWLLEKLPELLDGVRSARINYLRKELTVVADVALQPSKIVTLIAGLGYTPDFAPSARGRGQKTEADRALVRKIAVAGFGFGNAMLFSLPEYFSTRVEPGFAKLFLVLNVLLSTAVLIYAAGDFFRAAYRALRNRKVTIDLPISIGIATMFARSVGEIAMGISSGYFDTFTGLIFFLLISRYIQNRSYAWLNFERDNLLFLPFAVRVQKADGEQVLPIKSLLAGDKIRLLNGEVAPARCRVLSAVVTADYSFITGESLPVLLKTGAIFELGGKVVGGSVELEVIDPVDQAVLNRLWEDAGDEVKAENAPATFGDRLLPWFTAIVIATASLAFIFWIRYDPLRAWDAFSAVLVITCPCALAIARPFAFFTTQSALARGGLYLKSARTIQNFFNLENVIFDKTGTLTKSDNFDISKSFGSDIPEQLLEDVRLLASQSAHPLSQAIARHSLIQGVAQLKLATVEKFREVVGQGITGQVRSVDFHLGSAEWLTLQGVQLPPQSYPEFCSVVHVARAGDYLGYFALRNQLRPALDRMIEKLKLQFRLALVSGDSNLEAGRFEHIFGADTPMYFRATPQAKAEIVKKVKLTGRTMMVGDGLNDAAALAEADVGLAVSERNSQFSPASDGIIEGGALTRLPGMVALARQARATTTAAYAVSLLYNIAGVSVAVAGQLTPLYCAILMPISSLTVIGMTFAAARAGSKLRGVY